MPQDWRRGMAQGCGLAAAALALPFAAQGLGAAEPAVPPTASARYAESSRPPAIYDGTTMSSQYVAMRDGTRIAVDVIRPTLGGVPAVGPLPVIWMNTPYDRRHHEGGNTARDYPGAALALVRYGYVVAVADMRGNYASSGKAVFANRNEWMPWAWWDSYDITEWLAAQPWSDGNVGMWGCSATGHAQWQAAATRPPHLKAIFPMSAPGEYYDWGGMVPSPAAAPPPRADERAATPVDADNDGSLLRAAQADHLGNYEPGYMPFRDSVSPQMAKREGAGFRYWLEVSTFTHLKQIAASGIPAYQTANYGEDIRVKQGIFVKRANLPGQTRTLLAPGGHCEWSSDFVTRSGNGFNIVDEELRWFDHWLKHKANGIMAEPSLRYFTINAPIGDAWRHAWQWPLPTERRVSFYFAGGLTERQGVLSGQRPWTAGADRYIVDYSVGTADVDARGQTYTTVPLPGDTTLTGHSLVDIWISSSASDGDFVAWLEDVAPDGTVTRLPGSEDGRLRASHRALSNPHFNTAGLPWHASLAADVKPLVPGAPARLQFDLAPVSYIFAQGHRIRIAIAAVAQDRHSGKPLTPVIDPPPMVTFLRDPLHVSRIELPLSAPVAARAKLSRGKAGLIVRIDFPASLDPRYLGDVAAGSIALGGVTAQTVRRAGKSLLAKFPASTVPSTGSQVTGAFGGRYNYGGDARFVAPVAVGK